VGQIGEGIFHPVGLPGHLCHETPKSKSCVVDRGDGQTIDFPSGLPTPKGGPAHRQNRNVQAPPIELAAQLPLILGSADEESRVSDTEGLPHIFKPVEDVLLGEGCPSHG
jgi:hypothetical protein